MHKSPAVYLSFSAEISPVTSDQLLRHCAELANKNVAEVHLLLSSRGGSVIHGIHAYNMLRAMPFKLVTHNVGRVNSIGNVVFLAGEERYAVPHSAFMFHGVGFDVKQTRFEEKNLREKLDGLLSDQQKIGAIFAERTSLGEAQVKELFLEAVTRDPEYALAHGFIHDIREARIPPGAPVQQIVIQR